MKANYCKSTEHPLSIHIPSISYCYRYPRIINLFVIFFLNFFQHFTLYSYLSGALCLIFFTSRTFCNSLHTILPFLEVFQHFTHYSSFAGHSLPFLDNVQCFALHFPTFFSLFFNRSWSISYRFKNNSCPNSLSLSPVQYSCLAHTE